MIVALEAQLGMSWAEAKGQPPPYSLQPNQATPPDPITGKAPATGVAFVWSYCGDEGADLYLGVTSS